MPTEPNPSATPSITTTLQIPRSAAPLVGVARINGWTVLAGPGRADMFRDPSDTVATWTVSWDSAGSMVVRERSLRVSKAECRRITAGAAPKPPRFVIVSGKHAAALAGERIDRPERVDVCVCCNVAAPAEAELTVSALGLCWACDHTHRTLARYGDPLEALPASGCVRRRHIGDGVRITEAHANEPWRQDPRSVIDIDDPVDAYYNELERWFRDRGVPDAVVATCQGGFAIGFGIELGPPDRRSVTVVSYGVFDGWTDMCGDPIDQPARHEVLAMLAAAPLRRPARR